MEIHGTHHYDHSLETVFKCFGDKDATIRRFTALGSRNINIETLKQTKTSMDMVIHREDPVDAPTVLKKIFGEWSTVTQEEHWKGSVAKGYSGELKFVIKGVPLTITGHFTLQGDSKSCVNEITMKFESNIPLIGKKLAEFVATQAKAQMQKEYELILEDF